MKTASSHNAQLTGETHLLPNKEPEIADIDKALTEAWKWSGPPKVMFFGTPYGCLCVTESESFMTDDRGNRIEGSEADAADAVKWLQARTQKTRKQ